VKLLGWPEQRGQPQADYEEEVVRFDVEYLLEYLSKERGTSYRIVGQPDVQERQSPQPDYLIEDAQTGNLIAVEHARFFESEEAEKQHASWIKEIEATTGIGMRLMRVWCSPQELGKRLSEFVDSKLSKGQLAAFPNAERILLARNDWHVVGIHRFLAAEPYFKPHRRADCDHFYLIVERRLLQVV
jgi:hypothetical protein